MAEDKTVEDDRRDPKASERREGEKVTTKKLFNDYGFEEERASDNRRDSKDE